MNNIDETTTQALLERHEKLNLHNANEAETRLKLIDRIVFDILGWTHDDVKIEERVSEDGKTTFSDYILSTGFTSLVIEAKKVGAAELEVPKKRKERLNRALVSGETGEAIKQARDYGRKLSLPFAVVTNGNSWIIFPSSRTDGVNFQDSSAIVFESIKSALRDDFADFYNLLSRESVISGTLENELLGRKEDQQLERRLNQYFTTSFSKIKRNNIFSLVEDEISLALSEDIIAQDR